MKNILSYQVGHLFSGEEILEWAKYQVDNKTSHYKQGKRVLRMYGKTLNPTNKYQIFSSYYSWHFDKGIRKPLVLRSDKKLPEYDPKYYW